VYVPCECESRWLWFKALPSLASLPACSLHGAQDELHGGGPLLRGAPPQPPGAPEAAVGHPHGGKTPSVRPRVCGWWLVAGGQVQAASPGSPSQAD